MKTYLIYPILLTFLAFNSFGQKESKPSKDFIIGLMGNRTFDFKKFEFDSREYSVNYGVFVETEIYPKLTNTIFFSKQEFELKREYSFTYDEQTSKGIIRQNTKEESVSINQRFKYRFTSTSFKPFVAMGLGINYNFISNGRIIEIPNDEQVPPRFHYGNKLITGSFNLGLGLDWLLYKHIFLTGSLDWIATIPYHLSRQFENFDDRGIKIIAKDRNDFFLRFGIGYKL